jgi:LacI family transcriptional regulator, repressor for deo operon, udp, cdd, tsx, nupC, and nupG
MPRRLVRKTFPKSPRPSRASIRQVATLAGVSIATVSRALTTPDKVSSETRRKVLAQVERTGYRPNLLARNFRSKRAYSIVVLVPNIANPFFAEVIRGVEQVAQQRGYAVLLGDTEGREDRETYYVGLVETHQADGLIQLHARIPHGALAEDGRRVLIPFVNACECVQDLPAPTVRVDNIAAARAMTSHLVSLGHRRIGVILGPKKSPLTRDRLRGHRNTLRAANIGFDESLLAHGDFTMHSGGEAAQSLMQSKNPPTAIFCFNDEMAFGAIQWLKSKGLSVPQDVSVVGFDNIEFAAYCDPPLTTLAQPTREIGRAAMNELFEILNGANAESKETVLATQLIVRKSCASPPARTRTKRRPATA